MASLPESNCRRVDGDRPMEGITCRQVGINRSQTRQREAMAPSDLPEHIRPAHLSAQSIDGLRRAALQANIVDAESAMYQVE